MASESSCESDISESWSLVDINLNESGITSLEAYSKFKENESFSREANSAEQVSGTKCGPGEINSNQTKGEYDKIKKVDSEKLESNFLDGTLNYSTHEKQDSKDESSDEGKNDSCDGESIEILDIDENYICEDPDIDRVAFTIIGDDETNNVSHSNNKNYYYDGNFENSVRTLFRKRRKRRKSRSISESSSNSNSDILYYDDINSIPNLNVNRKVEEVKVTTKPIYRHCRNNFRNTALSLSLGVIFAGVACIAIGHFLGVHDAGRTADGLMNTLKKLESENFALQSRLSELDKGFASKNLNVKVQQQELYEVKNLRDSPQELATDNTESNKIPALNDRTTINSFEWFVKFQNLMKTKEFVQNQHFSELKKIVLHIHDHLSFLSSRKKNHIKLKNLEEKYYKITKVSQKILKKLTSSHEDLESSYQKLIELRDNLNRKLNKMFLEVSDKFCAVEQKNSQICGEKKSVVEKINCELLKCGVENENILLKTNISLLTYKFPQPEEYYLDKENSSTSSPIKENINLNRSSDLTNVIEKFNNKTEAIDQPQRIHFTMTQTQKKSERKKRDSSDLLKSKNKSVRRKEKSEKQKKNRKKIEKQINVFLKNEKQRVRKSARSKKSNERSRDFGMKQKNNFYRNFNIKISDGELKKKRNSVIASEKDIRFRSKFVKNKFKNLKLRRVFKLKVIKENSHEPENNITGFSLNSNFFSGNHSNYFNATGNWFFKWVTGREQSRYHQGLGDWQFDRAKGRKILRNEDLDINWHLKRAIARQHNRNKNELDEESYERKNYGEKGFYHEELSWI